MKIDEQKQIIANMRILRHIYGYTQSEIADILHMCRCTYTAYESGRQVPNIDLLMELSKLYRVSMDTLLQQDPEKFARMISLSQHRGSQMAKLIDVFDRLSPLSQGRIIERAEMLLESECIYQKTGIDLNLISMNTTA